MRKFILIALSAISLVAGHHHHHEDFHHKTPLVKRDRIHELKKSSTYEVEDYESHPFKNVSEEEFTMRLGLIMDPNAPKKQMFYGDDSDLPKEFDLRVHQKDCIHPIRNQKKCGSCWAFAASEVLSDRLCIATKGKINVVLSPQNLVSCDTGDMACNGGYLQKSWEYIKNNGLHTEECFPYSSGDGSVEACPDFSKDVCKAKYAVSEINEFNSIGDVKRSIMEHGPVETGFMVYDDFPHYKGGIYRKNSDKLLGGHAVKIVGWGTDEQTNTGYWIIANSWDTTWGENGFFRIAFGECEVDSDIFTGIPETSTKHSLADWFLNY